MAEDLCLHLARARQLAREGSQTEAAALIRDFCRSRLDLPCRSVTLLNDQYSLNSLHGTVELEEPYAGETELFFKYHQEDDEAKGVGEYYNSKLLETAGLPVDVPLLTRTEVGEQILFYKLRRSPRLADLCHRTEQPDAPAGLVEELIAVQAELDRQVGEKYLETLQLASGQLAMQESLHQLFFHRLTDGGGDLPPLPGGRLKSFYLEGSFAFPGREQPLSWAEIAQAKWTINGVPYRRTLGELFKESLELLNPSSLADTPSGETPVVLGHGDAHNANVWVERDGEATRLVMFDPAFAGRHLPALLAEVKPTFHNIFAHPEWLYHPDEAATRYTANARWNGTTLEVTHDWSLTPLRRAFLESKTQLIWQPLLRALAKLDPQFASSSWERYLRCALFCCPTLVMNLCAGAARHNPTSSLVGLSIAMMCGSEPVVGEDLVSELMLAIAPPL